MYVMCIHICMSVHVSIAIYMCARCKYHVWTCMWRPKVGILCLPLPLPILLLTQGLKTVQSVWIVQPGQPACNGGPLCLPPELGLQAVSMPAWLLCGFWDSKVWSSYLLARGLYVLNHFLLLITFKHCYNKMYVQLVIYVYWTAFPLRGKSETKKEPPNHSTSLETEICSLWESTANCYLEDTAQRLLLLAAAGEEREIASPVKQLGKLDRHMEQWFSEPVQKAAHTEPWKGR